MIHRRIVADLRQHSIFRQNKSLTFVSLPTLRYILGLLFVTAIAAKAQIGRPLPNLMDFRNHQGLNLLDTALKEKQLLLLGINKSQQNINIPLELKMLHYANEQAGYRYIIAPVSSNCAALINQFVAQNDYKALSWLNYFLTPDDIQFYRKLNTLNENKPDSLKFQVYGNDVERYEICPAIGIYNILINKEIPDRLRVAVESLNGAVHYQNSRSNLQSKRNNDGPFYIKKTLQYFLLAYDSLKPEFQEWLGDEWIQIDQHCRKMQEAFEYQRYAGTSFEDPWRETKIFEQTRALLRQFPSEKFMCIAGRCHAIAGKVDGTCELYRFRTLAYRLNRDSWCRNKVFNVGVFSDAFADMADESNAVQTGIAKLTENLPLGTTTIANTAYFPNSLSRLSDQFNFVVVYHLQPTIVKKATKTAKANSLYTGFGFGHHFLDYSVVNSALQASGQPSIRYEPVYRAEISAILEDDFWMTVTYLQQLRSPGSNYRFTGFQYYSSVNIMGPASPLKVSIGPTLGYQKHYLHLSNNPSDTVFISNFYMPKIASNPMFLLGGMGKIMLQLPIAYVGAELGYGRDLSDPSWRIMKNRTNNSGSLVGHQIYWNVSMGLHWKLDGKSKKMEAAR